jgi:hypothetical protein
MYSQILSDSSPFDDNFVHFSVTKNMTVAYNVSWNPLSYLITQSYFFNYIYIDL